MDGGAWWAAVHGVAKSQTRLSNFTSLLPFQPLCVVSQCPASLRGNDLQLTFGRQSDSRRLYPATKTHLLLLLWWR